MKEILNLINKFIKRIFKKNILNSNDIDVKEIENQVKEDFEEELTKEVQNDDAVLEKSNDKQIKKINSIKIQNINWEAIKSYDIVLARMNDEDIWYYQVGHEYRPFLVKSKNDKNKLVNGYYLTSNVNYDYFNNVDGKNIKIVLKQEEYKLNKNSLVLFQKEVKLPYEQVIHYIDHLSKKDLEKLEKLERSLSVLHPQSDKFLKVKQIPKLGDIVDVNSENYIIYAVDSTYCYGYSIAENVDINMILKGDFNNIMYNGRIYYIDYNNQKIFNSRDVLMIVGHFNEDTVKLIKKNKKEIKYRLKKR